MAGPASSTTDPTGGAGNALGGVQVGAAVGGLRIRHLHWLGGGGEGSDALAAEASQQTAAAVGGGVSLGHGAHYTVRRRKA